MKRRALREFYSNFTQWYKRVYKSWLLFCFFGWGQRYDDRVCRGRVCMGWGTNRANGLVWFVLLKIVPLMFTNYKRTARQTNNKNVSRTFCIIYDNQSVWTITVFVSSFFLVIVSVIKMNSFLHFFDGIRWADNDCIAADKNDDLLARTEIFWPTVTCGIVISNI